VQPDGQGALGGQVVFQVQDPQRGGQVVALVDRAYRGSKVLVARMRTTRTRTGRAAIADLSAGVVCLSGAGGRA